MAKKKKNIVIKTLFYGTPTELDVYDETISHYYATFKYVGWRKIYNGEYEIVVPKDKVDKEFVLGGDCYRFGPKITKSYFEGERKKTTTTPENISPDPDLSHMTKPQKVKKSKDLQEPKKEKKTKPKTIKAKLSSYEVLI